MNIKAVDAEERRDVILDLIKSSDEPIIVKDLVEMTGKSDSQIYSDLKEIEKRNPRVKHKPRGGYYWDKSEDRYPPNKNNEGYPDPTAELAMKMMDFKEKIVKSGEVWRVSSINPAKSTNLYYVVASQGCGVVNCLEVYHKDEWPAPPDNHIVFLNNRSYVDCRRILSKPDRYFEEASALVDVNEETFERVTAALADALGTRVVETVSVECEALHPVEQVTEPIDLRLANQKAEIYEKCFNAVVNALS